MGNLPANRLSAGRAFLNVGIDFGGPFISPNVSRSKVKLKSYLALFICMATKVVSDLSAEAFLAAFRRFISRRGKPTNMFSDNATNFKGASLYLKEQLKLIKSVAELCNSRIHYMALHTSHGSSHRRTLGSLHQVDQAASN
ncbi:integrase catalytic domain-containing protein [Trichonephila clavipes]|nr:integrase catalytic domain-containing protein [Trichonephila clavipes]